MTLIEAAKLAREAMDWMIDASKPTPTKTFADIAMSLRQAIAEAEQQEPVAWMHSKTLCLYETFEEVPLADGDEWPEPLYTTPQPQRELNCVCGAVWEGDEMVCVPHKRAWVGLTEEERNKIYAEAGTGRHAMQVVEAKLKEKNT